MSQFCIYVKLKPYLAEWLINSLGEPVRFPDNSNENAVIRTFIRQLPPGTVPEVKEEGDIAIAIPDSRAKPPMRYNYMGERGKKALKETIEDLFIQNLWTEMGHLALASTGKGVNSHIAAWCEMHGISLDHVETVRQKYFRLRKAYTENNIELRNFSREKK